MREVIDDVNSIFAFNSIWISPGVIDGDVEVVLFQGLVDVDDLGVAHVRTVLLESEAKYEDVAADDLDAFLQHQLDGLHGHILAHAVVHAATSQDNFGVVAVTLGTLGQIVRVDTDAVPTHQTRTERQEVPLGTGSLQHVEGIDAHLVEDLRKLVYKGDVDVALTILYHLGGLGHLDGGG